MNKNIDNISKSSKYNNYFNKIAETQSVKDNCNKKSYLYDYNNSYSDYNYDKNDKFKIR